MSPIEKAYKHVRELNEGNARWTMRIPVDRDRDSDCIIVDALRYAERRIAELQDELRALKSASTIKWQERRIERLEECLRMCVPYLPEATATKDEVMEVLGGDA